MELTWSDTEPGRRRCFHHGPQRVKLWFCAPEPDSGPWFHGPNRSASGLFSNSKSPKNGPPNIKEFQSLTGEEERDDERCRRSSSVHWRSAERRGGVRCFATTATTWALAVVFVCFQLRSELGPHQVVSGFHVLQSHLLFLFAFCELQNQVGG